MKRAILIVTLLLALCGASYAADPNAPLADSVKGFTFWGLTADNADELLMIRVGYESKRIEPGITLKWFTRDPKWGPEPDVIGGYLIYHVNEIGLFDDPLPDNPFEQILHGLRSRPYGGIGIDIPCQGEDRQADLNYIVGTLFSNDPDFKWSFSIEYIEGEGAITPEDERGVVFGARFRF